MKWRKAGVLLKYAKILKKVTGTSTGGPNLAQSARDPLWLPRGVLQSGGVPLSRKWAMWGPHEAISAKCLERLSFLSF